MRDAPDIGAEPTWPDLRQSPMRDALRQIATTPRKFAGVARFGGVGDTLTAASVCRPLKAAGYFVEFIASEPNACVLENNPHIDKLTVKKPHELPSNGEAWHKWFADRAGEYDLFANLSNTQEVTLAFFPQQTAFWWPAAMRRKLADRSYIETVHDVLGQPYDFGPLFFPTPEEHQRARITRAKVNRDKVVGWIISGTRLDKIHPLTALAIQRVVKELDVGVILFGAPTDRDRSSAQAIKEHVQRAHGTRDGFEVAITDDPANPKWPVRRVLSQLQECDLVIGPDTGPLWAVAFEAMPKVLLLSHASVRNISDHWVNATTLTADQKRVPCWPCHCLHNEPSTCQREQARHGMKPTEGHAACIADVSVEMIVQAISASLRGDS